MRINVSKATFSSIVGIGQKVKKAALESGVTIKWTKEKCLEEALKYSRKVDFQKNSGSAYQISYKNDWLEEICTHMKINKK